MIWKALLVIFVTSDFDPLGRMVMVFPVTFESKADCREFLDSNTEDTLGKVAEISGRHGVEVLGSASACFEDAKEVGT